MKTNSVPKIRFKGFTDDWEQRKLGEIADIVGGGTPSTSKDEYWDGDIDWYAPAEIINQIFVSSSERKITQEGYNNSSAKMLPIGTVLFTSRAGIGKTAILSKKGCTNQGFQSIVPHENELDSYFIFSRSEELKKYGETVGAGSTFVEVSGKQMSAMNLLLPTSYTEQQKIGAYFSTLDRLVTLHQRKCDQTKELKKFMLQKMFPKKGEKNPEIRFSGFTDDWEQRKVDDVTTSYSGGTPQAGNSEYYNGTIPFIRSGEIYESHTELFITEKGLENSSAKMVSKGDILYALYGATSGEVSRSNIDGAINQAILAITPNDGYNANFLVEWFRKEKESIIDKYLQGGQGNLSAQIIKKLEIPFPTFEEQNEIGRYFTEINRLITLHQRKCEQLKELKKFMLQNMFPKKG